MAEEAASLHVYGMELDGDEIPAPSLNLSKENTEGKVVMPVTIHPDLYRARCDNERIKTNITLPAWLKRNAEAGSNRYPRGSIQVITKRRHVFPCISLWLRLFPYSGTSPI